MSEKFTYLDNIVSEKDAKEYIDRRFSSKRMQKINKQELDFAEHVASLTDCQTLVDIPCGSGRFAKVFHDIDKLYGFDYNPHMVEEAKKRSEHKQAEFAVGDIKKIPLEDSAVNIAFSMRLLHHVSEDEKRKEILEELARVSKHWVALSFYRTGSLKYWRKKIQRKKLSGYPVATKRLIQIAKECGLKLAKIQYLSGYQTLVLFRNEKTTR